MASNWKYTLDGDQTIYNKEINDGHTIFSLAGTATLTILATTNNNKGDVVLHRETKTDGKIFLGSTMPIYWDRVVITGVNIGSILDITTGSE